jgi:hypothetical protein
MHRCLPSLPAPRTRYKVNTLTTGIRLEARHRMLGRARVIGGLLSLAALAGCGSSGGSSPTPRPSATPSPNAVDAAVLQAYRGEWAAFVAAVRIPDPAYPALAATTTDPLLTQLRQTLVYDKGTGIIGRGSVQLLHPHVVSVSASVAVVQDCVYSALISVYAATGQPVPNQPGGTQPEYDGIKATLSLATSGAWKVSDQSITAGHCPLGY